MQAQTWKQYSGHCIFNFRSRYAERLLHFEKAISKVICQMNVFMKPRAGWEQDEWDGIMVCFLLLSKVELLLITNVLVDI